MNKKTAVRTAEKTTEVEFLTKNIHRVMRTGNRVKATTITYGKDKVTIPGGTGRNLTKKAVADFLGINMYKLNKQLKANNIKWKDVPWGSQVLPGGVDSYIQNLVEVRGLHWEAIRKHLAALGVFKSIQSISTRYKKATGIIIDVDNDNPTGTHQEHNSHVTKPRLGWLFPKRVNTPGIYLSAGAHIRLDRVASNVNMGNGLIYALYKDKLEDGSVPWMTNDYRERFEGKTLAEVCALAKLDPNCINTFTPGPVAQA